MKPALQQLAPSRTPDHLLRRFGDSRRPPLPDARLGRDAAGVPGWFLPDPDRPGNFLQLVLCPVSSTSTEK